MRVVVPPVSWSEALRDFADPLQRVLDEVGAPNGEVWFGTHFNHVNPPPGAIIFQTEVGGTKWFSRLYRQKLSQARAVWDYSTANRNSYACREWHHVPLRFHESLVWPGFARSDVDIPVGFFGSLNPRRHAYIHGASVMPVQFGNARRAWLSRVGAIVAPHYYEHGPVEQARIGMLLANAIPVVAEHAPDESDYPGPVFADGVDLVRIARELTSYDGARQHGVFRANGTAHAAVRAALGL